ncbi:MAG: ATP-binding protein [Bacteroidaceae bacterium]|nr:ATP-binding protein [Bacteroidaceae bacterium]
MKIPFVYGRRAEAEEFTGRKADIARLKMNLAGSINTTIVSPRRWGKTSLVHRVLEEIVRENNKEYMTCHVDMFGCHDEEQFYNAYLNAILKSSATRLDDIARIIKKYVGSLGPKITLGDAGAMTEFSLGIDFKDNKYSVDEILDLPEQIAKERGKKFIVCIDEFQNIENFPSPQQFQARLRSHWQLHQHVCYCLYGSKRHMLLNMFGNYEMPFYKFGDLMVLEKIPSNEWATFIAKRFCDTGKHISLANAQKVAERVECHSYYVQQYSQLIWLLTTNTVTDEHIDLAFEQLVDRSTLLFDNLTDNLKPRQINFLLAIAQGEKNLSSAAVLKKYNLGTSANIKNLKNSVIEKDLVDEINKTFYIQDPIFKYWLLNRYSKH